MEKIIIIGGGTAGLFLAKELSPKYDVLVLEKSKRKIQSPIYKIPLYITKAFRDESIGIIKKTNTITWQGRILPYFESQVIGGASAINGVVHNIGRNKDWEKTLKKFNKSESELKDAIEYLYKPNGNLIKIKKSKLSKLDNNFFSSAIKICQKYKPEKIKIEFGQIENNTGLYQRSDSTQFLKGNQFDVLYDTEVLELLFEGTKIIGVNTTQGIFYANKIIVCAGTLQTESWCYSTQ